MAILGDSSKKGYRGRWRDEKGTGTIAYDNGTSNRGGRRSLEGPLARAAATQTLCKIPRALPRCLLLEASPLATMNSKNGELGETGNGSSAFLSGGNSALLC